MVRPAMVAPVPAPHMAMRAAPSVAAHTSAGAHAVAGSHLVRTRSGALVLRPSHHVNNPPVRNGTDRRLLSEDAPGLGFDFPHFAATHPRGSHDRDHDRNRQFAGAFLPLFGGGGYYMPLFPDDVEESLVAGTQQDEYYEEPEPAQHPGRYRSTDARQNQAPQNYALQAQPAAPERDSEEFVFVRRDGTLFFAVAYAWESGTLRYITSEGVRHTVSGDKLDLDATQQFNEQRGLNFHAPAA